MIPDALKTASALRVPVYERDLAPSAKIAMLEEFMLVSAYWSGECAELRLTEHMALRGLEAEWAGLDGWQALKRTKTETAVEDAKRQIRPDLHRALEDARWLVRRLTEEIDRLEHDATKVSRVYSMLTGT